MKRKAKTVAELIKSAAEASSDLNTFYIIISVVENGHLHFPSYAGGERIIKICHSESQKRLREYDRLVAQIERLTK
jgi:hypothetical protein